MNQSKSETDSTHRPSRGPKRGAKPAWLGGAFVFGLLAFIVLFAFTDITELWRVLADAEHALLVLPLLCVAASYVTMALSYHGIAQAAGDRIHFVDMLKITLVANSLNYLVATGGLSGFAARTFYFSRRSIPPERAVVISLAQTFLTNMTLLAFVLLGFSYVLASRDLGGTALISTVSMTMLLLIVAGGGAAILLHRGLRRWVLQVTAELTFRSVRRLRPSAALSRTSIRRYLASLDRGIAFLIRNKQRMIGPLIFITLDWIFTILILHTSFRAVRQAIPFGQTVVGFSVGIVLSFISLIPGGLGVMEGSMAAVFAGMGVPFESAVAAALLFRVFYYIVPLVVSALFLRGIFRQVRSAG